MYVSRNYTTVHLLDIWDEYRRYFQIDIRQCVDGGRDCRIHGLRIVGHKLGKKKDGEQAGRGRWLERVIDNWDPEVGPESMKTKSQICVWGRGGGDYNVTAIIDSFHRKKKVREFPVPSQDVTTKLSLGGNNDVITELFLPRGSLVNNAGDGKLENLFFGVSAFVWCGCNSKISRLFSRKDTFFDSAFFITKHLIYIIFNCLLLKKFHVFSLFRICLDM